MRLNKEFNLKLGKFIKSDSIVVRSPGRINLIGEHTDYNEGFVLPAAIDKAAYIVLTPRNDDTIFLRAIDLNETYSVNIDAMEKLPAGNWPNYLLGVVAQFKKAGIKVNGFDAVLTSDIPVGAGLSSSAAVECAMAMALNIFTGAGFDKMSLVKMAQKAEHEYAGVQCGIMDQFASMFGKQGHVIKLDCRSLDFEYVPSDINGYKIVLLDTNVKHSLASSEYNVRRQQCETGVSWIKKQYPHVTSLRNVTGEMLDELVKTVDTMVYNRCKYVVDEITRLLNACDDLKKGDIKAFGQKMFDTHDGLSKLYEVSCRELDFLVEQVRSNPDVCGARMMGGGFGGCTINLAKEEAVDALVKDISFTYQEVMKKELKAYVAVIANGTSVLETD